ncbi:hypothetical protein HXY32_03030 [Candidatus Bathyarchaeota archaeon]|nr:hypothetical protein [Candidatus Bathyarchaeota archaeon]
MHKFVDYFKRFEEVEAVKRIFGEKTKEILRNLKVEFAGRRGYMGVSDTDGHLIVSADYLKNGDIVDIYLDIIHELVHVKQFMEGKELFDDKYEYVERPTEIEAFQHAVEEARRLGLSEARICQYLKTEWISEEDLKKLAKTLDIKYVQFKEKRGRRIN